MSESEVSVFDIFSSSNSSSESLHYNTKISGYDSYTSEEGDDN